ncbi:MULTISPECIES: RDD family protein [Niastella]|uniref:RDD family protein n=1 Tax=Niastella soli TaxID=2821487 RepID=A0ABS3YQS5_9BACT|nr:RDD family protein [Niastella soli]MBO9199932.1 RDD family protein [Niastella soli]
MKKSTTLLVACTLGLIAFQLVFRFQYYTHLFSRNNLLGNPSAILDLFHGILYLSIDVATIVFGVRVLAMSDNNQKEKAYVLFRYLFVIMGIFSIMISTYYLFLSGELLFRDLLSGIHRLFNWLAEIVFVVLLIREKPEKQVQKVNLKDYDLVAFTTGSHRFVHYLLDFLFMLPVFLSLSRMLNTIRYYTRYQFQDWNPVLFTLCIELFVVFCYLLYYYLSEAIFRQTFGKMITNSCVVSDGVELSNGRVFLRTLCRLIPFDRIAFLFGAKWHDRASRTAVVYVDTWEKTFDESQPAREA